MINYFRFKRLLGCRLKRPCISCRMYMDCLEHMYDELVVVNADGSHSYSREEARKRGLIS